MNLIRCPRCEGVTTLADDSAKPVCRWCGRTGWTDVIRDPERVRHAVLQELKPIPDLLLTFGIGQTVVALTHFFLFFGCGGALSHFSQLPDVAMLLAIGLVLLGTGVFIAAAGVALKKGRGRLIGVVGAWLMLASPLLVGLPFGIWALVKLSRPEVRTAFRRARPGDA